MKPLLLALLAVSLMGQAPAPVPAAIPAVPATAPAESAVPHSGDWLTGWVDAGYRWNTGPGGSLETYRSVVNLGSGPKLIGADFTITDPHHRLFDEIHIQAYDWADPYSTLRIDAAKKGLYRFGASYRSLTYFNNLPSFADPLLTRGIMLDEQSFDVRRHLASFELHLLPQHMFSPYLAFDHDSDTGRGVSTFQTSNNEYAVPYTNTDVTNLYRGGVDLTLRRLHLTLEEGGTTFRSNQNDYAAGLNRGNSSVPVFGQTLNLTALSQAWGIRGSSEYSRVILAANPFSWIDVYAHFGYSNPHNDVNYKQYDYGSLVLLSQLLFFNGEQFLQTAAARMPHTSGDIGWEVRPFRRIRLDQHWLTDRLHNSGSSAGTDTLFPGGSATPLAILPSLYTSFLSTNYNETETGVSVDATPSVRLRGAYRYVWGDANDLVQPQTGLLTIQKSRLRRNVVIGSASWRVFKGFTVASDVEWGSSGNEYFRTSLYDYRKIRLSGRYDLTSTIHLSADYRIMGNRNPLAGNPYKSLSHQESASIQWMPKGKKIDFIGTYEHCGFQTEMSYLDPGTLLPTIARYREYCHDANATANLKLKRGSIAAGGSALLTAGSRPTTYYQPLVKIQVPITHNLGWFAVWQYYGFGETYYNYESFQTNLITTGLRFSR